jgi:hypothetical protein
MAGGRIELQGTLEPDVPGSHFAKMSARLSVGSHAQRAVAWRSGGPNVASSQNASRGSRTGEHQIATELFRGGRLHEWETRKLHLVLQVQISRHKHHGRTRVSSHHLDKGRHQTIVRV